MKDYGFRLKVKIGGKWTHGLKSYKTIDEAKERLNQLVNLGHPKNAIQIQSEIEIFC
ncbi:MAG: hypothetical protein GX913_09295 [Clostridiales bacterium]|nr:hypothetical protein [Clostridiales bacterium]